MQITQFLVGASFATLHLFIYYSVPVSTAYQVVKTARQAASAASSAVSSVATDVSATATATAGFGTVLKRLALRAAGEEGLAENIGSEPHHFLKDHVPGKLHDLMDSVSYETRYRNEYEWVQCIDTTGQSFAIWLNVMYLFPLTALFSRFFYKSYIKRTSTGRKDSRKSHNAKEATKDAARGVSNTVEKEGRKIENGIIRAEERIKSKEGFQKSLAPHVLDLKEIEDMKSRIEQSYKEILNEQLNKGKPRENLESKKEKAPNGSAKKEKEEKSNGNVKKEQGPEPTSLPSPPPSEAPTEDGAHQGNGDIRTEEPSGSSTPELVTKDEDIVKDENEDAEDGSIVKDEKKDDDEVDNAEADAGHGSGLLSSTDPRETDQTYADVVKDE